MPEFFTREYSGQGKLEIVDTLGQGGGMGPTPIQRVENLQAQEPSVRSLSHRLSVTTKPLFSIELKSFAIVSIMCPPLYDNHFRSIGNVGRDAISAVLF